MNEEKKEEKLSSESEAVDVAFWHIVNDLKKGFIAEINKVRLLDFCSERLGYFNYIDYGGGYNLIKINEGCIIKDARIEDLKHDIKSYLREEVVNELVWAAMVDQNYFDVNFMQLLSVKTDIEFNSSTKDKAYFYYMNGIVAVSKTNVEIIPYSEYEGYVWQNQINKRVLTLLAKGELSRSEFRKFMYNLSGQDAKRFKSLISVVGFILHPFKNPAESKALILLDENIDSSGLANGGTGKSLLVKGITYITPTVWKDGKRYNGNELFGFDDIRPFHRVLYFDDTRPTFGFEEFYPFITGDIQIKRKYKDSAVIPFNLAPKLVISSNHIVLGTGGETDKRRRIEFEVAPHYSMSHRPIDEFGHNFFDEWESDEWNLFDNLMMFCVQFHLNNGIVTPPGINLIRNKLIALTNIDFIEFADLHIKLNERIDKSLLLDNFKAIYSHHNALTGIIFKRWLDIWGNEKDFNVIHSKSNGKALVVFSLK